MNKRLFSNRRKNIFLGASAAAYLLISLLASDFGQFELPLLTAWRYYLNNAFELVLRNSSEICILIYLLTLKKEYRLKRWLLPIGFGCRCLHSLLIFPSALNIVTALTTPYTITVFILTLITSLAVVLTFVGTLFDFEFIKLFRSGLLLKLGALIGSLVPETVYFAINGYFDSFSVLGMFSLVGLAEFFAIIAFDIGLFLLTTNKEKTVG